MIEGGAGTGWTLYPPALWSRKSSLRVKLLNSGDLLKLKVPNSNRKVTSGWIYYLCRVISLKITYGQLNKADEWGYAPRENEMENRGSKADFFPTSHRRSGVRSVLKLGNFFLVLVVALYIFGGLNENSTDISCISLALTPIITYSNAEFLKKQVFKENKGKSGIYKWTNALNNKSYIGSGIDLTVRLRHYYSLKYMTTQISLGESAIYSALLKYGLANFSLTILEYCDKDIIITREQYYLDLLKPEYNILLIAGASPMVGRKHSEESRNKIRKGLIGNKNGSGGKGRARAEGAGSPNVSIEVFNLETGIKTNYPSMSFVCEHATACSHTKRAELVKQPKP